MCLLRKLASAAAAAVMAGGALLATAPGSYAASEPDPALLVDAPTCVKRAAYEVVGGFDVYMKNKCGRTMYVRVIVDWAPDSVCIELLKNQGRVWSYQGVTGQYNRLALC